MNVLTKKIIKWLLCVIGLVGAVGFLTHFVLGIYNSCVADDIITAQDRVKSAYQFWYMIFAGLVMLVGIIGQTFIKINILPEKIRKIFFKKED